MRTCFSHIGGRPLSMQTKTMYANQIDPGPFDLQKSAEQGFPDAQSHLGFNYQTGSGVPVDQRKAYLFFQKAADQGFAEAQNNLGAMHAEGIAVPKDATKAAFWIEKAAIQGHVGGQNNLAKQYFYGNGVPKDAVLAYAWFNLAASAESKFPSITNDAIEARLKVEKVLTPEELAEAQQISSAWKVGQRIVRSGRQPLTSPTQTGALSKRATGTIFLVSNSGHAITNYHVTQDCAELRISSRDGVAKLIVDDAVNDIALVQIPGAVTATASIATDPQKLRQGENIYVYGFPLNALLSSGGNFTPGVVSAMTGLGNNTNQIQITAPIQPGSVAARYSTRMARLLAWCQ